MTEDSIIVRSPLPYQIGIFLVVNLWAVMCYEMAQYQLVDLGHNLFAWLIYGTILLWSMTPILSLFAWKMKDRVEIYDPVWEVKIREVNLEEFEEMMKDYNSSYKHIHTSIDFRLLVLIFGCHLTFFSLPFYTMTMGFLMISITPLLVALVSIPFGLFFSYFIFKLISNSATREFPTHNPKRFRNAIHCMMSIPGIFWSGIRLSIGESQGYYTLRNPIPIARIEGIEGIARLECIVDNSDDITKIVPIFEIDLLGESNQVREISPPINSYAIAKLVRLIIVAYIQASGGEEILEDVLEEIDMFLRKHEKLDEPS
ncbi:hypothetical protein EU528_10955 [Candidatus Thorarchaeota archaeon]|nr:MAG: hypothetical protein EU528_10955 [Candidatus Thorarchaeota archaeon]